MRKSFALFLTALLLPALALALPGMSSNNPQPQTEGQALLQYLAESQYQQEWAFWPGKEPFYPGQEPHGALLTTYVNEPALEAILARGGPLPPGSLIVKENYTADRQLAGITAMYKEEGFNPQAGDWFWLRYTPDGRIDAEGRVQGCIDCHRQAAGNDYLFTGRVVPE